jgi:MFS family permease
MFATYWFQDFYSGLKPLMESQMGITPSQYGDLISSTTIANLLGMIIIGGIILDKWGIRLTAMIFGSVATLGGIISALGANDVFSSDPSTRLIIMIIGRVLFGIGLEITCVLITRTIVKWFNGYELALAMAINMGIGRLGSAIGTAISPEIANNVAPTAVTFAAFLIAIGFIFYIIYLVFDVKLDKQLKADAPQAEEEPPFKFEDLKKLFTNKSFLLIAGLCVAFYSAVFPFMQYAPDLLVNKYGFSYALPEGFSGVALFGSVTLANTLLFIGLFIFGVAFPLVPANIKEKTGKMVSVLVIGLLFIGFLYTFRDTFAIWIKNGPKAAALLPMGTIFFTPIFGRMVDKKGKAASVMMLGAGLLIFSHVSLSLINNVALCYLAIFTLGIAFSLVPAAMWPSVARIVPERRLGTAYAGMFTIQNYGLFLFFKGIGSVVQWVNPEVVKKIQDIRTTLEAQGLNATQISEKVEALRIAKTYPVYDYTIPILCFVACGVIAVFLALALKKTSVKQGYNLEEPFGK